MYWLDGLLTASLCSVCGFLNHFLSFNRKFVEIHIISSYFYCLLSLLMLYVIFVDDVYYLITIFILKPRASHLLSVIMSYISVNMAQINKK